MISELREEEMAKFIRIPAAQFKREVQSGEWNGTFKKRMGIKFFVIHLVMERQRKQALESITIRKVAA